GFLTINKEGIIEEGATRVSQDLLEVNLTESEVEKIEIWDVLFQEGEKRDIFKKWIEKVFESKFSFRDLKGLAPKKFEGTKEKHIELEFRPIYEKESKIKVDKIVIIASDKTKEVELKEQLNRDKENIEFINKCLQNPLEFVDLIFDTQTLIHDFYFSYKGEKELLFRGFHTLKARFGLFGLKKITNLIDNIETAISEEKVGNMKRSIKLLDEKLISFMKTNRIIVEAANKALVEEGSAIQVSEVLKRAEQFNVKTDYIDYIKKEYLYSDIKTKFERYVSLVNELAQRQDKSIEVKISGEEILVDTNKYSKFINSSIHIFRNMVDHGIEPEDERIAKTKPQKGKIKLLFKKDEKNFEIEMQDDGQGINLDKIKKKVLDDGLKSKDEISNFNKQEILNLIFLPGFSTKEDVTDISGRGVGMDAVKKEVIDLNGDIQVSSKIDEGTTFVIKLPLLK
ncbi:MAG: ATP-binding protein, partial [Bdellovibrionota bacterium]|nr:ATP-binding protein [Bdellovibrionota bacterium]